MTTNLRPDLAQWTTARVAEAYVDLMRQHALDPGSEGEMAALQVEWARRPAIERLAALRSYRDKVRPKAPRPSVEPQAPPEWVRRLRGSSPRQPPR